MWPVRRGLSGRSHHHGERRAQKGEEKLYREEKYAAIYEINMLRCIFCGDCEEACPKEAIFLTDRLVPTDFTRKPFVYGKEWLVEPLDPALRVDVSKRQTPKWPSSSSRSSTRTTGEGRATFVAP